jgi:chromosome segregation ATPase
MEQDNFAALMQFIGEKFELVDRRFESTDEKITDTRRHMGVLIEAVRDDVRQLAEGLAGTNQRLDGVEQHLDRFEQKVETEFIETRAAIRVSYTQLDRRLQELEGQYASLNKRVTRLESGRV